MTRSPPTHLASPFALAPALALALAAGAGSGCGADFEPYSRLSTLRVLAVKSTPAAPVPGDQATLEALVYTPEPGAPVSYTWRWCPFAGSPNAGLRCELNPDQQMLVDMLPAGALPASRELGTDPTATFTHQLDLIDPAVLAFLCAGFVDCQGGLPIQIQLTVESGGDKIDTIWTMKLHFDPAAPPNQAPQITELFATVDGTEQTLTDELMDPVVTLPRGVEIDIRAAVAEDQQETYKMPDGTDASEFLTLFWFIERGGLDEERTGHRDETIPFAESLKNKWEVPAVREKGDTPPPDTSFIYVVLRDGQRGGVSWIRRQVRFGAAP
jgi:hypothetical protein